MRMNDSLLNPFGERDYPIKSQQVDMGNGLVTESLIWISECCLAEPYISRNIDLDMSTVPFGGPSGYCSKCYDNCIFILNTESPNDN